MCWFGGSDLHSVSWCTPSHCKCPPASYASNPGVWTRLETLVEDLEWRVPKAGGEGSARYSTLPHLHVSACVGTQLQRLFKAKCHALHTNLDALILILNVVVETDEDSSISSGVTEACKKPASSPTAHRCRRNFQQPSQASTLAMHQMLKLPALPWCVVGMLVWFSSRDVLRGQPHSVRPCVQWCMTGKAMQCQHRQHVHIKIQCSQRYLFPAQLHPSSTSMLC